MVRNAENALVCNARLAAGKNTELIMAGGGRRYWGSCRHPEVTPLLGGLSWKRMAPGNSVRAGLKGRPGDALFLKSGCSLWVPHFNELSDHWGIRHRLGPW